MNPHFLANYVDVSVILERTVSTGVAWILISIGRTLRTPVPGRTIPSHTSNRARFTVLAGGARHTVLVCNGRLRDGVVKRSQWAVEHCSGAAKLTVVQQALEIRNVRSKYVVDSRGVHRILDFQHTHKL